MKLFPATAEIVVIALQFWFVWWAWNTFAHDLLGWPAIDYWFQALALTILSHAIGATGYHLNEAKK